MTYGDEEIRYVAERGVGAETTSQTYARAEGDGMRSYDERQIRFNEHACSCSGMAKGKGIRKCPWQPRICDDFEILRETRAERVR